LFAYYIINEIDKAS